MSEQIVELSAPGLSILLYSPQALSDLRPRRRYVPWLPDGRDLIDHVNECELAAFGVRWPDADYWLHFSSTLDHSVIARASDHVRLGMTVTGGCVNVRGGDALYRWDPICPNEHVVSVRDGLYHVTVCMVPYEAAEVVRIYLHFAPARAKPELGYAMLPELFCEAPLW